MVVISFFGIWSIFHFFRFLPGLFLSFCFWDFQVPSNSIFFRLFLRFLGFFQFQFFQLLSSNIISSVATIGQIRKFTGQWRFVSDTKFHWPVNFRIWPIVAAVRIYPIDQGLKNNTHCKSRKKLDHRRWQLTSISNFSFEMTIWCQICKEDVLFSAEGRIWIITGLL